MATPITIPRLGWTMEEGIFLGWHKADGDAVRAGEALFALESDKASEDIECLDSGVLRIPPDGPRKGDKVTVGTLIGMLVQPGESLGYPKTEAPAAPTKKAAPSPHALLMARGGKSERSAKTASPRARRAATSRGIDWTTLQGTGRTGRIRERDVLDAAVGKIDPNSVALSPIRRLIAQRMAASLRTTAPVTLTTTADATHLVELRNDFKAASDDVPTYTDMLVKLLAIALQKHPMLSARWDGEQIVLSPGIHIGVAVDTDAGLLVPVLRDVPTLSLKQLTAQSRDLIERARLGKLLASEMQGGAFTITNLGAFGIDAFTPIINQPECAILGVGRIRRVAVVVGDQIVARDQLTLSLTFDHRIVDGAPAARFLHMLSGLIENAIDVLSSEPRTK